MPDLIAAGRDPVEPGSDKADEAELQAELVAHLVKQQPAAIIGNLALLAFSALVFLPLVSPVSGWWWVGAVFLVTLARTLVWYRAAHAPPSPRVLKSIRLVTASLGLAWGIGVAAQLPALPHQFLALSLLIPCGLVAAATATFAADRLSYGLVAITILGPQPIAILAGGTGRFEISASVIVLMFWLFSDQLHRQNFTDLRERLRVRAAFARALLVSRREHRFLDALFASVPNAIAVVDRGGVCLSVNPGFERLFGYSPGEALGRTIPDLIVTPSGADEAKRQLQRVLAGENIVYEADRCRRDRSILKVRVAIAAVEGDDQGRVLGVYTDLTDIRRTEERALATQERLEQVLTASTAVLYTLRLEGASGVPTWVSDNAMRVVGYPAEAALENPAWWSSRIHEEDRDRVMREAQTIVTTGTLTTEYRFMFGDGQYHWVRDESRLVRDAAGLPREVFGTWMDITDLKRAEAVMREARDLAEQSARSRSDFLANMSHEIRTPMNAVLGITELMLDTDLTADQRRSLRLVQSAGETLLTLLNDILDLTKIEAEHLELEAMPFDVRYLIESTVGLLSVRAVDRPLELIADVRPSVPPMVTGDPTRLRQVLSNLLGNALKFTKRGEVVVSVEGAQQVDGACRLHFAVRDTGIGIPAEKLETIFDDFTQADASMTRKYGGTGLGLAIAKRLVRLMGGTLGVTSELGKGSEFAFTLELPRAETRPAPILGISALAGQRMLIVDDNETNRRIVGEILRSANASVVEAGTADEGIAAVRQAVEAGQPFGLAVIDAQMPDKDGFAMALALRTDAALVPKPRLLMLTSAGRRGDVQRCREAGIEAYLMKPVSRSDLLQAVAELVDGTARATAAGELITTHTIAEARPKLRILLAEDNRVNQEVAATMLRRRGHTVTVVSNGRAAVSAVAAQGPFDLVLMDIQMPELDGFEATREIRAGAVGASVPIVALTAHALSGERDNCLQHGMDGYLVKPFRPHELFSLVEGYGMVSAHGGVAEAAVATTHDVGPSVDLAGFVSAMQEAGAASAIPGILDLFVGDAPARLSALRTAVDSRDLTGMQYAAHAFRSPAGSIGAHRLEALLNDVELAAHNGDWPQVAAAFDQVVPEVNAVLAYLRDARAPEVQHA